MSPAHSCSVVWPYAESTVVTCASQEPNCCTLRSGMLPPYLLHPPACFWLWCSWLMRQRCLSFTRCGRLCSMGCTSQLGSLRPLLSHISLDAVLLRVNLAALRLVSLPKCAMPRWWGFRHVPWNVSNVPTCCQSTISTCYAERMASPPSSIANGKSMPFA